MVIHLNKELTFLSSSELDSTKHGTNQLTDDGMVSCVTALGCARGPTIASILNENSKPQKILANEQNNNGHYREKSIVRSQRPIRVATLEDLIHLPGPLTEDAVLKCLQARFCAKQYHVSLSKIKLFQNDPFCADFEYFSLIFFEKGYFVLLLIIFE